MNINEKWAAAQKLEAHFDAVESFDAGIKHFHEVYNRYFEFLDISRDLNGKMILEIGPANFPALTFCHNYANSYIIEPMESPMLATCVARKNIKLIKAAAEDIDFPSVDEVWMLNVLQHVKYPDAILKKARAAAPVIRFFEPINQGTSDLHLHNLTLAKFISFFRQPVKYYPLFKQIPNFHTSECAYGVINLAK